MKLAIFGSPASGKGTLAKRLSKEFKLKHISTGEILRRYFEQNKKHSVIDKGEFVSDELIIKLVKTICPDDNYLLDGIPRTLNQIDVFKVDVAIHINCSPTTASQRMLTRNENRADDSLSIFTKRLNLYNQNTVPVINEFFKRNIVIHVDGENTVDVVFEEAKTKLHQYITLFIN